MNFSVTRSRHGLVPPHKPTPTGTRSLSVIDKIQVLRCNARTLHVFKNGVEPSKVIKHALSMALVPYYPLAGRLKESSSSPNELQVELSGDGVWFVEASANCTLDDVGYFGNVESIAYDKLLPDQVTEMGAIDPLVLMQVTEFRCGGFVIGLIFCHTICDGLGAAQFLNAVGEFARGSSNLTVAPVWQRDFSPLKPEEKTVGLVPVLAPPPMPDYNLHHASFDIPLQKIKRLKQMFHDPTTGQNCSAFEIVAASIWSCRSKAINFKPNTELKLVFFANCRGLLNPPLPGGFYGNCFYPVTVVASSELLAQASISDIVKLVQNAKTKLPDEFTEYMNNGHVKNGVDPFLPPLDYATLFISEWGRLGFNEVDYGWGKPVHIVPIQGSSIIPASIVGSLPSPMIGVRLMTWCVEQAHLQPFLDHMTDLIS